MNLKGAVVAAASTIALACGMTPAADAATVTAAQVAGQTPVGTVKAWDARSNPPLALNTNRPQSWTQQVDHKNVLSYQVYSPSMRRDIPVAVIPATNSAGQRLSLIHI